MMLLVECAPDEALARKLGVVRRECLHFNGKPRVCNWLKRKRNLCGMIDEDPGSDQPPYLRSLRVVAEEHGIRVLRDAEREHRVIVLRPRLEEWLISRAAEAGIALENHGLPSRGNDLHREINFRLRQLDRLLDALLAARSPGVCRLRELLRGG